MRVLLISVLALTLAACSTPEEAAVDGPAAQTQVTQVLSVDAGQMADGIMLTAVGRDLHNGSHSPVLLPAGQVGDVLIYDFTVQRTTDPLGNKGAIQINAVTLINPATAAGASSVLVRGVQGDATGPLPVRN